MAQVIGHHGEPLMLVDARDLMLGDMTDTGHVVVGLRTVQSIMVVEFIGREPGLYPPGHQVLIHDDRLTGGPIA